MDFTEIKLSGKTRREHDLLGEMEIPEEYYFGVQTMRAVENFHISRVRLNFFPRLIHALADVKQGLQPPTVTWGCSIRRSPTRSPGHAKSCVKTGSTNSSSWTWYREAPAHRRT